MNAWILSAKRLSDSRPTTVTTVPTELCNYSLAMKPYVIIMLVSTFTERISSKNSSIHNNAQSLHSVGLI